MKKKQSIFLLIIFFMCAINTQAQKVSADFVNVPGPLFFDNKSFSLSWSSHPANNFYKQEYLVKGDIPDQFKMMLLTDVVTGGSAIKEVVNAKLAELKKMKEANPIVNYEVISNAKTGEYLIDFLLAANDANGNTNIVERNVYRYKSFTDKSGKGGVQLFGVSERSYGSDINKFLVALKTNRKELVNKVALFKMPEVKI
ncbi:MAG: hypothetical protein ABI204_04705 [Ginsengibacter sp.]